MRVAVIGYGRFGKLLSRLLKEELEVVVYDPHVQSTDVEKGIRLVDETTALECETLFYAVPIRDLETVIQRHVAHFAKDNNPRLVIDTLSVKLYPKHIFERLLPSHVKALLTHPMFGPDSVREHGLKDLPMIMHALTASPDDYAYWKAFFSRRELRVIELTPDEHDHKAAWSQGIAHFIGRVLEEMALTPSEVDTIGAKRLLELRDQVCNDSWQLFTDLQTKNPYTIEMRVRLGQAVDTVYNRLLPNRINMDQWVVGIQGGRGSFNEQAAMYYLGRNGVDTYSMQHLYTTEAVLRALHEGRIDRGQFAIHNSLGGMVEESVDAMANYKFRIVEQFAIKIAHALMIRSDASLQDIRSIMAHPQVFRQCQGNLDAKYMRLARISGSGNLIDSAHAAERLAQGTIDATHAVMGPRILADMFGLTIVEDNLQDLKENYTSFLWVERP